MRFADATAFSTLPAKIGWRTKFVAVTVTVQAK
jgi:hypothetical protein